MHRKQSVVKNIIAGAESTSIFRLLSSSFHSWYKHWPFILLSAFIDFIFVIAVSSIVTVIQFVVFDHLESLMTLTGQSTGGLLNLYNQTDQVSKGISSLSSSLEFQSHLSAIFKYLGIMIAAVFLCWIVFQGLAWFVAYRMSTEKRQRFIIFAKNFILASIPFYLLTVVWIFLSVRLLLWVKMSITPAMSESLLNILFAIIVMVTWYFGTLCYTITNRYAYRNFKSCFIYGIKKFPKILPTILVIAVLFLIIDAFLRINIIRQDSLVLLLIGTVIFLPALNFTRILLFKTRQRYLPEEKHK
ncbi:hypothetical protein HZB90_03985 [archaeon]|nr:hypothetical protein [archaeon]